MALAGRVCTSCATPIPGSARTCPSCGAISLPGLTGSLGDAVAERLRAALGQRYRIERELGEGGMAVVFLAHDLKHDRHVAVKVLRPELAAFLGGERFLREIHIAAQLNHPHILPLHDSGDADGLLFYVMPYVEGDSLRGRLVRQGPLPLEEAVRIASEVADGLAYAHDLGVIHRDIKPENILLSHGHAAIADFGIARAVAGAGASSSLTTAGVSLGTPSYMSPEQANGDPALDHRADIYSLGCTLYEMLAGRPPYPGPTPQALVLQHLTEPVPAPRDARPDVPVPLDAAVRRAMAKTAADRFQTAAEFRAALRGARVSGRPPVPGPRMRWRRAVVATTGVAVVAGAAILVFGRGSGTLLTAAHPPLRVVVRHLEDRTGNSRLTADRISEALTDRLQAVPALDVAASAMVAQLRDAPLDSVRARFAPDRFVLGRVESVRDSLVVTVQIVDPRTARALATSSVKVPRGADVVAAVAEPLSVFVRHAFWAELERAERRAQVRDSAAWDLVARAREQANDAEAAIVERLDRQGFRSLDIADSLLQEAHKKDGRSNLISIDLARNAERRAFYVEWLGQVFADLPAGLPRPAQERTRALAELDRLVRGRRVSADVYELRGRLKEGLYRELHADSLLDGAISDYRAAAELDRHRATAWKELGSAYRSAGLYSDALLAIQHAFEEDAFQLYRLELLRSQFDAALLDQRSDLAAEACRTGLAEAPRDMRFLDCEVQLWSRTRSDRRSAAAARARVDSLGVRESGTLLGALRELWVADVLARAGLGDSADHVARRATANQPADWQPLLLAESAYLRILRRDADSALALLTAAVRRNPNMRRYLRTAPWFQPLRADPRFARLAEGNSTPP